MGENNQDQWIIEQNIKRFQVRLEKAIDEEERRILEYLLEQERRKVHKPNGGQPG